VSTESPETKNPYQLRREAVARAIKAWQEEGDDDTRGPVGDAAALEDCLLDEDLTLMPRSTGHGAWRVLVDGQPAPYLGRDEPSHPMGAEEAAEVFLTQTGGDYYNQRAIVVRPATDQEMVVAAVIGDTTVHEEPTRIAPTVFMVETEENVGATLVRMIDKDGREVMFGLDDHMRDLLVSMLDREDGTA
jgi:hypothetical protein